MIARRVKASIHEALAEQPVVILTGLPRVGRTELANMFADEYGAAASRLDASRPDHQKKLACADALLKDCEGKLVVIDNIDESTLHSFIQLGRSAPPQGSSSRFILIPRRASDAGSLAQFFLGNARRLEVVPIQPDEARGHSALSVSAAAPATEEDDKPVSISSGQALTQNTHWLRGGLPESIHSSSDERSLRWRQDYLTSFIAGGFSEWGIKPSDRAEEVLLKIAEQQGQVFQAETCGRKLNLKSQSVENTVSALIGIGLVRALPNWTGDGQRVLHIRDSGLCHALLRIETSKQLSDHSIFGYSWQSFAAEALANASCHAADAMFYRDDDNNEIDLILKGIDVCWAVEFKTTETSRVKGGFWKAVDEVEPTHKLLVHSGNRTSHYENVESVPLITAIGHVQTSFQ